MDWFSRSLLAFVLLAIGFFLGAGVSALNAQEEAGVKCVSVPSESTITRAETDPPELDVEPRSDSGCAGICVDTKVRFLRAPEVVYTDCG